jgi:hypothetical protein
MMDRFSRVPFYPVILSLFPVLTLLAQNADDTRLVSASRSILISAAGGLLIYLLLAAVLRSWERAAIIATAAWVGTLSYGHIYRVLDELQPFGFDLARHRYLIMLFMACMIFITWWAWRRWQDPERWTGALNLAAIAMITVPLVQIGYAQVQDLSDRQREAALQEGSSGLDSQAQFLQGEGNSGLPDIYYIILDGYGRDDMLQTYFGFDNQPFLEQLKAEGFYVAECSQSNYSSTALSLTSSLNMTYLDELPIELDQAEFKTMGPFARQNKVRQILESLGYDTVSFESEYFISEWRDADHFLSYFDSVPLSGSGLNAFETIFFNASLGRVIFDLQMAVPEGVRAWFDYPTNAHRQRILFTLDQLEKMSSRPSPKFVMAHVVAPHEPFVIGPEGEFISARETFTFDEDVSPTNRDDYLEGYTDQVKYLNSRILQIVRKIIAESDPAPVIILQADHGTSAVVTSEEGRMSILNAYFLPGGAEARLYPSISPVNSFRVVMDEYFQADYALLADIARFSNYGDPFGFKVIPNSRDICQ